MSTMNPTTAEELGRHIRETREAQQLSTRALAEKASVNQATIVRIERGEFAWSKPEVMSRIAEALGLSASELFARADVLRPADLPSLAPYLRTKYRDLPDDDVDRIEAYVARLASKHGINLRGPAPGQDES